MEDNKKISVRNAPTRWGHVSFSVTSMVNQGKVEGQVVLPASFGATVKVRMRLPEGHRIQSATVNGKPWTKFDPQEETVTLPPGLTGTISLEVNCL
jgi:flagella basal body P-ring formation protein FlgA